MCLLSCLSFVSMILNLKIYDKCSIKWIALVVVSCSSDGQSALITRVARELPFQNISLSANPYLVYTGVSKLRCTVECASNNCTSFNFGMGTCELLHTYVCGDYETLTARASFKHYDVEFGIWIQASTF